ncbi:hypothetical protein BH18THE2_BH18THE2_31180 [soil metagenome]
MSSSYDKAKHIVEVDEKILAVFIVDSAGKLSDLFVAKDANIENSFIETIRSTLDIRFEGQPEGAKELPLGRHLWDIIEYDKVRLIKIYESARLIVVLAKSHSSLRDVAETVLGYLYESEDEQPKSLF